MPGGSDEHDDPGRRGSALQERKVSVRGSAGSFADRMGCARGRHTGHRADLRLPFLHRIPVRSIGADLVSARHRDALEPEPEALNFYIGHELGHIRRNHLLWGWVLLPASILPLLGAAYSRAREYTCDMHGLACCRSPEVAARGLGALAAGGRRWRSMDLGKYAGQSGASSGFWMSFHELVSSYPWLVKRMARILPPGPTAAVPGRNAFAWILALFVPRIGMGGSAGSLLVVVAIIGILAAIALPAYQDYTTRAKISAAVLAGSQARVAVSEFYIRNNG